MFDAARQLHFTRSLERLSARFDELLQSARIYQHQLPAELVDEIAFTAGELMLVLTNHPAHREEGSVRQALSHAGSLRGRLRANQLQAHLLAQDCDSFRRVIAQLVINSKRAA